jgi:hypothetical protein
MTTDYNPYRAHRPSGTGCTCGWVGYGNLDHAWHLSVGHGLQPEPSSAWMKGLVAQALAAEGVLDPGGGIADRLMRLWERHDDPGEFDLTRHVLEARAGAHARRPADPTPEYRRTVPVREVERLAQAAHDLLDGLPLGVPPVPSRIRAATAEVKAALRDVEQFLPPRRPTPDDR